MKISHRIAAVALALAANLPAWAQDAAKGASPDAGKFDNIGALDFRRAENGAGRIVVALPGAQVGVDIRNSGNALIVEFARMRLPEALRRKYDVGDFGTPVQTFTAQQVGDKVRLQINANPTMRWVHSAYQRDSEFVVEVTPQADVARSNAAAGTAGQAAGGAGQYSGQKLSLNFQSIDIRALLQIIADFTGFNVVTSDAVTGTVTLRLQDVPWDQALDIILQAKGLDKRRQDNVLWIAPREEIVAKERLERESQAALETLEPVRTQSFQLNYAKAVDVARQLSGVGAVGATGAAAAVATSTAARILSPRGSAIAEARTNQLFVTDIGSRLAEIQTLIAKLDVPVRQVLIEARIVEASDSFNRSLGVRLGGVNGQGHTSSKNGGFSYGGSYSATAAGMTGGSMINLPSTGIDGIAAPTFAVSIFGKNAASFLNLEISALEADGKGQVISSPRVVTADKVKAIIEQGTELPYQVASSSGATSIAFRKANLMLEVTPQITPEGNVILELDVSKDTVGQTTPAGFAIDTKHVQTQVLVENGGTVVIGGIYTMRQSEQVNKVPWLGDIPLLGFLFRNTSRVSEKDEMLIFITPRALTQQASLQ